MFHPSRLILVHDAIQWEWYTSARLFSCTPVPPHPLTPPAFAIVSVACSSGNRRSVKIVGLSSQYPQNTIKIFQSRLQLTAALAHAAGTCVRYNSVPCRSSSAWIPAIAFPILVTLVTRLTLYQRALLSGDFNFIHINPYFLNYASLPDTITTRGLWSSAATRRYVENVVAMGRPDALGHSVSSVGIVLAGDKLAVKPWHTAMRSPLRYTSSPVGDQAWICTTTLLQLELLGGCRRPSLAVYKFFIIGIVNDNRKEETIHFGGIKSQAIRKRYMDVLYSSMDTDGDVKMSPLPIRLLFAMKFRHIALALTEKATFEGIVPWSGILRTDLTVRYAALWEVVGTTPVITGLNYNVEGQQGVCVGESAVLQTMTNVLNHLRIEKIDVAKVRLRFSSWPSPSNCATRGGGGDGATIDSEELPQPQADQEKFAAQHVELYMRHLGCDSQPRFDLLKAWHFDSSWNCARQDAVLMYYDIVFGRLTTVGREITARCIAPLNQADLVMLTYIQYNIDHCDASKGDAYKFAEEFGQRLINNIREVIGQPPLYKDVTFPLAKRDIVYSDAVREDIRKLEAYVEMASGDTASGAISIEKFQDHRGVIWEQENWIKTLYKGVVQFLHVVPVSAGKVKRQIGTNREYSSNLTGVYLDILHEIAISVTTFKDKNSLVTGIGAGSIGVEIVKGLLQVESNGHYHLKLQLRDNRILSVNLPDFRKPRDIEALVDDIHANLGMDPDCITSFAGIPKIALDDKSEPAHHMMLVDFMRDPNQTGGYKGQSSSFPWRGFLNVGVLLFTIALLCLFIFFLVFKHFQSLVSYEAIDGSINVNGAAAAVGPISRPTGGGQRLVPEEPMSIIGDVTGDVVDYVRAHQRRANPASAATPRTIPLPITSIIIYQHSRLWIELTCLQDPGDGTPLPSHIYRHVTRPNCLPVFAACPVSSSLTTGLTWVILRHHCIASNILVTRLTGQATGGRNDCQGRAPAGRRKCTRLVITVPTSAAQLPHSYELTILGFQRFRTAGRGYAGDVVSRSSWSGGGRAATAKYYQGKGPYARLWVALICNMRDGPTNGSRGP
ncbi:hypothetical protein BD779DRAFT_1480569 [Infundibulicybe gibba]|nr:hypothetical protein BD779DRAFT_1480569 [Infundibulicybe gibba]